MVMGPLAGACHPEGRVLALAHGDVSPMDTERRSGFFYVVKGTLNAHIQRRLYVLKAINPNLLTSHLSPEP